MNVELNGGHYGCWDGNGVNNNTVTFSVTSSISNIAILPKILMVLGLFLL